MKIIQTFWSGNQELQNPLDNKAGWLAPEYHWMSWALSCLLLRRHYDRVELYTDSVGKTVLIDMLRLPYTDVHIIFDQSFTTHPKIKALSKIFTYSRQKEPFIHIDGDIFMWKRFPEKLLNAELIASNIEIDLYFNKDILDDVEKNFRYLPKYLKGVNNHKNIFSSNTGIVGGSNIPFIQRYCEEAFHLIKANSKEVDKINKPADLIFLFEQMTFFYYAKEQGLEISHYMKDPVTHPLYENYWRFADVPDVELIHVFRGSKMMLGTLDHMAKRLRMEFPEHYYLILRLCKDSNMPLANRLYELMDMEIIANGGELHDKTFFQKALKPIKPFVADTDFKVTYKRTLYTISHYMSLKIDDSSQLSSLVEENGVLPQIKEIWNLENQALLCLNELYGEIKNGELYGIESLRYNALTELHFSKDWTKRKVALNPDVLALDLKWNWNTSDEPLHNNRLDKLLTDKNNPVSVTLSKNLLNLGIWEIYHDGLDEVVLRHIQGTKTVYQLLSELTVFFDGDISVENPQYQRLIYDILKRLAFSNILSIF